VRISRDGQYSLSITKARTAHLFFLSGGICMALVFVLIFVLPELGRKNVT
jgi:hypothetical protein